MRLKHLKDIFIMAETNNKKLFAEFPPVTTAQWEAVIAKDLKGADYEKKLVWRTMEGFNVRPYYRAEDLTGIKHLGSMPGEFPFVRGTKESNEWLVRQEIEVSCPKSANEVALDILNRGVNSLNFVIANKELTAAELDQLLKNICIKSVELNFSGCGVNNVAGLFIDKIKKEKLGADDVNASFNIDPIIKKATLKGVSIDCSEPCSCSFIKSLIESAADYKRIKFVTINGDVFANSGATIVQELAFTLSVAHDYIACLMSKGMDINTAARTIKFNMAIGPLYFMEIAKFRAARMLWATIVKEYNPTSSCAQKMKVHATTSAWNTTIYDPHVNMLRGTTEAMSAALAGVSSIEVLPFNSAYETPTEFSSRIARNVQLLLKEESHLDQVVDPAGGAYYIESLTQSIAEEAWKLFKLVEEKGGYLEALKAGFIQEKIEASAAKKNKDIATRKDILLGTNQYPNFNEHVAKNIKLEPKGCKCECSQKTEYKPLKVYRGAMEFENLRLTTERSGKTPIAFMLTVGSLSFARARAQFACNFFACAGFKVVDNNLFSSIEEGVKAAREAKADVIVICSSDDDYATKAPELFTALNGKGLMVVAGEPACKEELEAKGIKNFISVRSNVLETLVQYQKELGIK